MAITFTPAFSSSHAMMGRLPFAGATQATDETSAKEEPGQRETDSAASERERRSPFAGARSESQLSAEELKKLEFLKARDREVKAHEMAHLAAAGTLAVTGASFDYQIGPNGQRYAVGGEVGIDTSPVANDPLATLRKAEQIRRAALAPAKPSSQDYAVASKAMRMAAQARAELIQKNHAALAQRYRPATTPSPGASLHVTA